MPDSAGLWDIFYAPGAKTTTIQNCYSTGKIAGPNCVGGIVGGIEIRRTSGISLTIENCVALNSTIKSTYVNPTTEETDGLFNGSRFGVPGVSLQNRVVGGIWENTVDGAMSAYTLTYADLYALNTTQVFYNTSTAVASGKTQTTSSPDGQSITSSDLETNAHNWTDSVINDVSGTIAAGAVTYFDSAVAGNPDSVWYYYQDKEVLPVLNRYLDNYQQVLLAPEKIE